MPTIWLRGVHDCVELELQDLAIGTMTLPESGFDLVAAGCASPDLEHVAQPKPQPRTIQGFIRDEAVSDR